MIGLLALSGTQKIIGMKNNEKDILFVSPICCVNVIQERK